MSGWIAADTLDRDAMIPAEDASVAPARPGEALHAGSLEN
jgi:hypothetical protein